MKVVGAAVVFVLAAGITAGAATARAQDTAIDGGVPPAPGSATASDGGAAARGASGDGGVVEAPSGTGVADGGALDAGQREGGARATTTTTGDAGAAHPAHPYVEVVVPRAARASGCVGRRPGRWRRAPRARRPARPPVSPPGAHAAADRHAVAHGAQGGHATGTHGPSHGSRGGSAPASDQGRTFYGKLDGEYRVRLEGMSDIPLEPLPGTYPPVLGQNFWADQWIRIRAHFGLRPHLEVVGQIDLFDGVLLGHTTSGVAAAKRPRNGYSAFPGVDPRWLYLDWYNSLGLVRAGLAGEQWGLGIVANDGEQEPVFGDYHYGDRVLRVLFGAKPFGLQSPVTVALAGDSVFDDITADIRQGDHAWEGVLAAYWEKDEKTLGFYGVYRAQTSPVRGLPSDAPRHDRLDVGVLDLFARWHWDDPGGGRIVAAIEGAGILGTTTLTRTVDNPTNDVRQLMVTAQLGRKSPALDVMLEGGYASGDSNTEDAVQRQAIMDPDHHVGLILFPEVMAFMTARSATLAQASATFGRPAPGSNLLPTNGGVSNAFYLFPWVTWRVSSLVETRLGAVWAVASTDVVDPYVQKAESRSVNYRGGDPRNRDLGFEVDGAFLLHGQPTDSIRLEGGLEGGVLLPGHAFDNAAGEPMAPVALGRVRLGMFF